MFLLISIVIAIVNVIPLIVYAELDSTIPVCRIALPINKGRRDSLIYSWSQAIICFLMPAVLILILNIKMVVHLKRPAPNATSTNSELRHKRQRQATRVLTAILSAFIILVAPLYVSVLCMDHLEQGGSSLDMVDVSTTLLTLFCLTIICYFPSTRP